MTKILAINGSYRKDGITDQTLDIMLNTAQSSGAEFELILLREYPIEFCINCRECTQQPGEMPGSCVQTDNMAELVRKIEAADAYILASPTNFGSVTAIFKRFMERLVVYAYWPWEMNAPQFRKAHSHRKKALLVSSCAAPAILGRWVYTTTKELKMTAKTIGADPVGILYTGLAATQQQPVLPTKAQKKAKTTVLKLL